MRNTVPTIIALTLLLIAGGRTAGKERKKVKDVAPSRADVDKAVAGSLGWLDKHLFKLSEAGGTPTKQFTYATAGLVYLMAGRTKATGIATDPVEDIKDYLVDYVDEVARRSRNGDQLPPQQGHFSSTYLIQYTWPIAQAGLFFSELLLRKRWPRETKATLTKIRKILEEAQDSSGGWGHHRTHPRELGEKDRFRRMGLGKDAGSGYPSTLIASTNTVAATLGVVESVLGRGSVTGLDRARRYYDGARLADGNFPYDPSQKSAGVTGVSRAGGSLMALHFLGVSRKDAGVGKSRALVRRRLDDASEAHGSSMLGLFGTAVALRLIGDEEFAAFRRIYFSRIVAGQAKEGNLLCVCQKKHMATSCDDPRDGLPAAFGRTKTAYTTTLLTFILLLDRDRLKILGRKPVPAPPKTETTKSPRRKR